MPPKKNSPNGFMIFTYEWKDNNRHEMSVREATTEAGTIWAGMSPEQRKPYNDKAKARKQTSEKLTCTGKSLSSITNERKEADRCERQIKRNIETTVRNSLANNEVELQSYFFIMANYFARTLKGGVYIPAEISVSEYSLKQGVSRVYHTLINPGVSIYGHQYEALHHSRYTHNLPLPPKALGDSCLARIYNDIIDFVCDKKTGKCPPVYTARDSIQPVTSILDFLMVEPNASRVKLDIYPIQYLFFVLKEVTCEVGVVEKPTSIFITDAFFERDQFEYTIGCKYHDDLDRNRYCTKSYVTRWGYVFSDYMCADLAIALIQDRHVPKGTNVNAARRRSSINDDTESTISMMTDTSFRTAAMSEQEIYHDDPKSDSSARSTSTVWQSVREYNSNDLDGDEYPSLGGSTQKNRKKIPNDYTTQAQARINSIRRYIDNDERELNPWAMRSKTVPPKPVDSSVFDVRIRLGESTDTLGKEDSSPPQLIFGRGRKISLDTTTPSTSNTTTTSTSSCGRGRLFLP